MNPFQNRRDFLSSASAASLGALAAGYPSTTASAKAKADKLESTADTVIALWLAGGFASTDTFDPKRRGDPKKKTPGSYYDPIDTAVPGVQLCEHFPKLAPLMDRVTAVRTVHLDVIDEHAAATNRMHK